MTWWKLRYRYEASDGETFCEATTCISSKQGSIIWQSLCSSEGNGNATCDIPIQWQHASLRKRSKKLFAGVKSLPPPKTMSSAAMYIPRRIAQTGPPKRRTWAPGFEKAYGSWQREHRSWLYRFWDDDWDWPVDNPNLEPFVARHFPFFLPAWRQLCTRIMRFDVARAMWLYVHGGVYADLDVEARRNIESTLRGAHLVIMGDDSIHGADTCPPMRGQPRRLACGPHLGNYLMASIPGHPFWLFYLRYVADNVVPLCQERTSDEFRSHNILELTGPWGMGRAFSAYMKHKDELKGAWPAFTVRFLDRPSLLPDVKRTPPRPALWDRLQEITAIDKDAPLGSMHVAAVWQAVEHDRSDYDYRRVSKSKRTRTPLSWRSNRTGTGTSRRSAQRRDREHKASHTTVASQL